MAASQSSPDDFKGPRGVLQRRCGLCNATSDRLFVCTGCQVVRYCSRDHQVEHRHLHKTICNKIKKCRTKLEKEEHQVRNATPDFMTPANAFESHVGHFWGLLSTRNYIRARFALADALRKTTSLDGVKEALHHTQDMMRLCRSDNLGVRDLVPALMLQLDQDQDCYDFIKWWATTGKEPDYDWGDMERSFLDVKDANVFESPDFFRGKYDDVNHVSALLLLNLKILVDVLNLRLSRQVLAARAVPPELWQGVEQAVIRSPLSAKMIQKSSVDLVKIATGLLRQIRDLSSKLREANRHVINGLFHPDEWLSALPEAYSSGSPEEMQLVLHYSYAAWWQTVGVLELLRDAKRIAALGSEDEMDDMMAGTTFRRGSGSYRTKAELLDDVSRNRIWAYIEWAIEDAGTLSAKRPSERRMEELRAFTAEALREEAEDNALFDSELDSEDSEDDD